MTSEKLSIVYTDGLKIEDPSLLSTLALFYDEVVLPHPYDLDPECNALIRWPFKYMDDLEYEQKRYLSWRKGLHELFDENLIKVLPPPIPANDIPDDFNEKFSQMTGFNKNYYSPSMVFDGHLALTVHALFNKSAINEWSLNRKEEELEVYSDQILQKWINIEFPMVKELKPQEILELREKLSPLRKGAKLYINSKLTKLYEILNNVDHDTSKAIDILVKGEIKPEISDLENKRFMESLELIASSIKTTAGVAKDIISMVIQPWDWRNYPGLFEKFGEGFENLFGHYKDYHSKENRALQFVGRLKKYKGIK